jgi:hypothetical protein
VPHEAEYQLVRVEAEPKPTSDPELACVACGDPLNEKATEFSNTFTFGWPIRAGRQIWRRPQYSRSLARLVAFATVATARPVAIPVAFAARADMGPSACRCVTVLRGRACAVERAVSLAPNFLRYALNCTGSTLHSRVVPYASLQGQSVSP